MYEYTGASTAYLALIEQAAQLEAVAGLLPVAVRAEESSGFSASFQGGRAAPVRRCQSYLTSYLGGAGKCQFSESLVVKHILA